MQTAAAARATPAFDPYAAAAMLRLFMAEHGQVRLLEEGLLVARLTPENAGFSLSVEGGRLVCHFWTPHANLVRRVVGVAPGRSGQLRLQCLRMGRSGTTSMTMEGGTESSAKGTVQAREDFRQLVVALARREWPEWRCEAGGAAAGQGPAQRLLFRRGRALMACVALSDQESAGANAALLTQALLWSEAVAERHPESTMAAVRVVLPEAADETVRWRLGWLRRSPPVECYRLDASGGRLNRLALDDHGNVNSRLRRALARPERAPDAVRQLAREVAAHCPEARLEWSGEGRWSLQVHGLTVASEAAGAAALASAFQFGLGREQTPLLETTRPEFERFLAALARWRTPGGERRHPLYALQPERWLEQVLRSDPTVVDAGCDPRFVYAQVPVCLPGQRDVLDLLTVDREGRLLVWELKAEEDAGFPLQGLDYWMRVRYHQERGDFTRLGYFPGVRLSEHPPRLCLIAPALRWHAGTTRLLPWIAPQVGVERVGINEAWREGVRVVARWGEPAG